MWTFETEAWASGHRRVAGVDEVGRGPLAGPVVACAVLVPQQPEQFPAVNDSKALSEKRRRQLAAEIRQFPGLCFAFGIVESQEIDRINILRATHMAMKKAIDTLAETPDFALVDGRPVPGLPVPSLAIVKGDGKSAAIAAASILAKVHRDALMTDYDKQYPGYGFAAHKGYGTQHHLQALAELGPCPIHRLSFGPVKRWLDPPSTQLEFNFT